MSLTIRYVSDGSVDDVPPGVYEHFIDFIVVSESTGENLTNVLLEELEKLGLDFADIRGQGYDNGANMKGEKSGVQARLREINPRALFSPCACHSYNLLLGDMAKCCPEGMTFFGILQRLYLLFSGSGKRWEILRQFVTDLTPKPLCETRWECRVDSVKAVRYQAGNFYDALVKLSEETNDPKTRSETESLANELKNFKFLVSLCFWYDLLFRINTVSKELQGLTADFSDALNGLEGICTWLTDYRQNGFSSSLINAREIAEDLDTEPVFKATRIRKRRRMFDYEQYEGEDVGGRNAQEDFRINCFNMIVDTAIASLQRRFEQLRNHNQIFGFIYNFKELPKSVLKSCGKNLEDVLTHGESRDVDGYMLAEEMDVLKYVFPDSVHGDLRKMLTFLSIKGRSFDFPNLWIALRIALTIPVTVASGERSFSKLKLIKTYLRSTMCQDRLRNMACGHTLHREQCFSGIRFQ